MSAKFHHTRIEPGESASLCVSFLLGNASRETWRTTDGFRIGSQFIDARTNLFIEDGPRLSLSRDLAPGETEKVALKLEFPTLKARYRVFISPMVEDVCWYYDRKWPFLVLDVAVQNGRAAILRSEVVTMKELRAEIFLRSVRRAFIYPFRAMWRHHSLIRSMTKRDILGRYRGSFAGMFWTLLNPLLLMLTYFFVFGIVLQTRFHGDPSRSSFVLYFLAGMLPWLPFSEAAGRAPTAMLEYRNFVKKLVFPLEILSVNHVAAALVTEAFAFFIFLVLLLAARGAVPVSIVWLPVILVPQVCFTLGIAWFLAALGVYVRDLSQINGFLLTLWFFLTPICYPEELLPAPAVGILSLNPVFVLVRAYRAILLEGLPPAFSPMWKLWLLSAAVLLLGHAWFYKLKKSFVDVI
jgi:lipopolysaccharide transport system permease protein